MGKKKFHEKCTWYFHCPSNSKHIVVRHRSSKSWPIFLDQKPRQVGREVARQLSGGGSVDVATFEEVVQTLKKVEETQELSETRQGGRVVAGE